MYIYLHLIIYTLPILTHLIEYISTYSTYIYLTPLLEFIFNYMYRTPWP